MATKINKKFILVVTGFVVAAALLLGGAVVVYKVYVQDAERNIVAGDRLMNEGKVREAFLTYGRAVKKKPGEIRYIEKMESALDKTIATTATQAAEDYTSLVQLKMARTRAKPTDPEQWKQLLAVLEDEATIYGRGEGWSRVETSAKEMKDAVSAEVAGAEWADIYAFFARAQRDSSLSASERSEAIKGLQALSKKFPGEWRIWDALATIQFGDVERAQRAGQADVAKQRLEQLDATLAAADAALSKAGPRGAATLAKLKLIRLTETARKGDRINIGQLDPLALNTATDAIYNTAIASGDPTAVRTAATMLATVGGPARAMELLDEWVSKHPDDVRTRTTGVLMRAQMALQDAAQLPALRVAAKKVVDQPQLPASLNGRLQENFRANALSALLNVELTRITAELPEAERVAALAELGRLREQLLASAQNDENSPIMISADAKLAQVKGDLPGAQRKWDLYFTKVPPNAVPGDAYLWASLAARGRGELGKALELASKGMEVASADLQLAVQRADLCVQLGRWAEAEAILTELSEALPDNQKIKDLIKGVQGRQQPGAVGELPAEVASIEAAVKAGNCQAARTLAQTLVDKNKESPQALFVQIRVEMACNDLVKAKEYEAAALARFPTNVDLIKLDVEMTTDDSIKRVELLVKRVVVDPRKQPGELLSAYRSLRGEMARRLAAIGSADPTTSEKINADMQRLSGLIDEAEKQALVTASDDPIVIESAFAEALADFQTATQANRTADAQAALARAMAQLEASRKVVSQPELPIVLESSVLEAQGKVQEALDMVVKARAAGRAESRLAARLAALYERLGAESKAFDFWKEAYDGRPNDVNAVLGYARALGRVGRGAQALDMLRAAADTNQSDVRLPLTLAQFETLYGSRAHAVEVRESLSRRMQPIAENVAGLYSLLYMPPSYDALKGADGKRLSQAVWSGLDAGQRARMLSDLSRQYQDRAEELYKQSLAANPLDIGLAVQKARVMREQGRPDDGTKAIQAVIDAAKARGPVPSGMYLDLGLHLLAWNDVAKADRAFADARAAQDPTKREADLSLVEIDLQRGRVKEAAAGLEAYAQTHPRMEVQARLCQLLLGANDFDGAEKALERAKSLAGANPGTATQGTFEMLAGAIVNARAEAAERAGKLDDARRFRETALAALGRAEALQPSSYAASLRRVEVLRAQAKSGGQLDQRTYELAVAEADKLLARNAALYEAASARADLELDRGDIQGAIGVLDKFMVAQPMNDTARSRLVQMYMAIKSNEKAIALAKTAIDLAPTRAEWRERLGDLLSVSGDKAGASGAYELAFKIQPSVFILLAKSMDERTDSGAPQDSLALLQNAGPDAQADPAVRASQAVALHKLGRTAESLAIAKEAITSARAAGIQSPAMQRVLPRLRQIYPADKTKDMEALIVMTGAPNTAEKVLIGGMWIDVGPTHADDAMKWADSALADGPSVPSGLQATAQTMRGNAFYMKGDIQNAIKAFQAAAELESASGSALNNAAYVAAEAGVELDRCLQYAERAVALAPAQAEFLDTLGFVLLQQARKSNDQKTLARAEEVLKRAVLMGGSSGTSAAPLLHLGMVQELGGRTSEARRTYEKAHQESKATPELLKKIDEAVKGLKQ